MWLLNSLAAFSVVLSGVTFAGVQYYAAPPNAVELLARAGGIDTANIPRVCWLTPYGNTLLSCYGAFILCCGLLALYANRGGGARPSTLSCRSFTLASALGFAVSLTFTAFIFDSITYDEPRPLVRGTAKYCSLRIGLTAFLWTILCLAIAVFHVVLAASCLTTFAAAESAAATTDEVPKLVPASPVATASSSTTTRRVTATTTSSAVTASTDSNSRKPKAH